MTDGELTTRGDGSPPWLLPGVAAAGIVVCATGALADPAGFWPAYLPAYLFGLGLSLGSMGWLLLHHVTGGRWGWTINRELTAAVQTLPLMPVLFLPLLAGLGTLYVWFGGPSAAAVLTEHQRSYLNPAGWLLRVAGYFGVWLVMCMVLSRIRPRRLEAPMTESRARLSAIGLILFWVTITFAAVDWMMSLEPDWSSTIYGALVTIGFAVEGMAGAVLLRRWTDGADPGGRVPEPEWHDLGNLLQAVNLVWVYFVFSQYLIIWSGDLASEVVWYERRGSGVAGAVSVLMMLLHFVIPFMLLLSTEVKRDRDRLAGVAVLLLVMRLVDLDWLIWPALEGNGGMRLVWQIAALAAIGALWMIVFRWRWSRLTPVPAELVGREAVTMPSEMGEATG